MMMMQSIAQEVAPVKIRVNAIAPGAIRTPINTAAWSTPEAYSALMTLVPYQRIYGVAEPARLPSLANDGKKSKHLPEGTPFGLVGSSSLYKRESFPNGIVPQGSVTATGHPYAAFGVNSWIGSLSALNTRSRISTFGDLRL